MKQFFFLFSVLMTMYAANSLSAQQDTPDRVATLATALLNLAGADRKMDAGIFASADPETLKKFMPEGGAPASTSSYALVVGQEMVLFDAGLGDATWLKSFDALAQTVGDRAKPENVKLILLTHLHGDHTGGLLQGDARRFPNAKALCSKPELDGTSPAQLEKFRAAYGQDFSTFNFDDWVYGNAESVVKIKALDASGHTPGHAVFLVSFAREGKELKELIIGDLLHAVALQFPAPEVCARYDSDQAKAVVARKRILDFAAQEKIPVRGMHFPSPYKGTVEKNEQGGYTFRADE